MKHRLKALVLVAGAALCVGVAVGYAALGAHDTHLGNGTLAAEAGGDYNVAIGEQVLGANTTGTYNTGIGGRNALQKNTTGNGNTAAGSESLRETTTGHDNTGVGGGALIFNTTGFDNTGVGLNAGENVVTGSEDTFLGNSADVTTGDLTNATAIGAGAVVGASDSLVLGATDVNVGVNTSTPKSRIQLGQGTTATWSDFLQLPVVTATGKPPAAACNNTDLVGRLVMQEVKKKVVLWACSTQGAWVKI
jgi:hypothetical protein